MIFLMITLSSKFQVLQPSRFFWRDGTLRYIKHRKHDLLQLDLTEKSCLEIEFSKMKKTLRVVARDTTLFQISSPRTF